MIKTTKFTNLILLLLSLGLLIGGLATTFVPIDYKVSLVLILSGVGLCLIWPTFQKIMARLSQKQLHYLIYLSLVLILIVQLFILKFMPATIYHDPFRVLSQAEILSQGDYSWAHSTYFWRYPNNVALTALLAKWLAVTNWLHLSTNTALHILSLLLLDSFIWMSLRFTSRLHRKPGLTVALMLFFVFSPWAYTYFLQVFYSDLPTLWALMFSLVILQKWPDLKKRGRIGFGVSLVVVILLGQLIKPNLIVFGIATGILIILRWFTKHQQPDKRLLPLLLILLGFALTIPAKPLIQKSVDFTPHPHYELPAIHWIYMSYNPHGSGTYDGQDVGRMIELPDQASRQAYIEHEFPKRLETLGPVGIVSRWVTKIAILLNVDGLPEAYTSGFIEAPKFYQRHQNWWQQYSMLMIRLSFILIYALSLFNVIRLWRHKDATLDPILLLSIITAVGYVAFHGLLWETENRYGQSILPLLIILNAQMPAWSEHLKQAKSKARLLTGLGLIGLVIIGLFLNGPLQKQDQVVVAQKSQLSAQYNAKWQEIKAHSIVSQDVVLNHAINYFSVSALPGSKITVHLIDCERPKRYELRPNDGLFVHRGPLPMGRYQIVLKNIEPLTQPIQTVQTQNYQLTPHPLKIDGRIWPNTSLLYIGIDQTKAPD